MTGRDAVAILRCHLRSLCADTQPLPANWNDHGSPQLQFLRPESPSAPSNVAINQGLTWRTQTSIINFVGSSDATFAIRQRVRQIANKLRITCPNQPLQASEMDSTTTTCNEPDDYEWLTGDEAAAIAVEIAARPSALHQQIDHLRRRLSPERARLVLELVELRRRAAEKFSAADRMYFTRIGLEQSTDEWVARYKARRFATLLAGIDSPPRIADLCCGIGGDLIALASSGYATGIDRDPCVAHLARANARIVLPREHLARVDVQEFDVEQFDLKEYTAWHLDPDRRPQNKRRTSSLDWSCPDSTTVERLLRNHPHASIKLAPGAVVPSDWHEQSELEWISRDRQCRQLVAWHGALARARGGRCATVLTSASAISPPTPRTITGIPDMPIPIGAIDNFLFDTDPAVSAARLSGAIAAEHNLSALSAGPTYLTGPTSIDDAALACFQVTDVLPLQLKQLARYFRARSIGRLEIKKRGRELEVDPEKLRRSLKLRGENAATLLIARIEGRRTAIVAQRVDATS